MTDPELCAMAQKAAKRAYAPYSAFCVGAALLCEDGGVYTGCNIENASYGATVCAERAAIFRAVSDGKRRFVKIAIACGSGKPASPCGVCRQVMAEFCEKDFEILLAREGGFDRYTLGELLPLAFRLEEDHL